MNRRNFIGLLACVPMFNVKQDRIYAKDLASVGDAECKVTAGKIDDHTITSGTIKCGPDYVSIYDGVDFENGIMRPRVLLCEPEYEERFREILDQNDQTLHNS